MNRWNERREGAAARSAVRAVWVSGLLALALLAGLAWYLWSLEPGVIVLQFAFTPKAFGEVIHSWSPADLVRYRRHLPVDLVLLAAYGLFGHLLVTRTSLFGSSRQPLRRVASWFLPLAALFDAMEDALHWWLTEVPRFGVPMAYAASAGFSVLKWAFIVGFGLLVAYALFRDEA